MKQLKKKGEKLGPIKRWKLYKILLTLTKIVQLQINKSKIYQNN